MEAKQNKFSNTSWLYKLWVILRIICLFVYYTILQPIGIYCKDLIAEQSGSIRYKDIEPIREGSQRSTIRKFFIIQSTIVLAQTLVKHLKRYKWIVAISFFGWLAFVISILLAIEAVALWFVIWIFYITIKSFLKGVNQ